MSADEGQRKLAAILAADAAGYSRLMAEDDRATVAAVKQAREVFRERIEAHGGRLVDTAGDSVLAEFRSDVEAVQCAVEVQDKLKEINAPVADDRRMLFRIGVNTGDVIEEADGTLYGDGVNVAARLEGLAEPGSINISARVHDDVEGKVDVGFVDIGEHEVKNIARPVRAYRVVASGSEKASAPSVSSRKRLGVIAAALAGVIVLAGIVWWQTGSPEPSPMLTADGVPTESPALAMPTGPAIAVLPFDNFSGDADQDYFANGLTENIITALSHFQGIRVIARNSTFKYQGRAVDVREVASDLGADYVLEGSVRRTAESIRVTVQLLDPVDGSHIWAKKYDRIADAAQLFAAQDEITDHVAAAIAGVAGVIVGRELGEMERRAPGSLFVYDCVLLAQHAMHVTSDENHRRAKTCLKEAIASDPSSADAWAALANLYEGELYGIDPEPDAGDPVDRMIDAARKALEFQPRHPWALYVLASAHFWRQDREAFFRTAKEAIAANPNDATTIQVLGDKFSFMGDSETALALVKKAVALTPDPPPTYWMTFTVEHYGRREYEAALKYAKRAETPGYFWSYLQLAMVQGQLGNLEEGRDAATKMRELNPEMADRDAVWAEFQFWAFGDDAKAHHWMEGLEKAGLFDEPEAPSRPVIAVLPFDNLSGDPSQEYFADGITEDIITRLAQYPDILVLGRNTTFQFKGQAVDIPAIAEKLGADYVVEGSIRRGGNTVRVTAQLLGAEGGTHVWAETYDRALDPENLFTMQDKITSAIASRIGDYYGAIGEAEFQRTIKQAPDHLSSYECVLRFFEYGRMLSPDTHRVAIDCLEAVVEVEPDYAEAMAFLVEVYLDDVAFGFGASPNSSVQRALELAQRAVAIESDSGSALIRLARAYYLNGDVERAYRATEKSLELEPNSVDVIAVASDILVRIGKFERGFEMLELVQQLNPNYPPWMNWDIAIVHMARGEYTEAIARLEQTQMDWQYWTPAFIAAAHCQNGDIESRRKSLETALQLNPDLADVYWRDFYFWNKGPDVRPMVEAVASGLEACGWDVPPDPGREAFAGQD